MNLTFNDLYNNLLQQAKDMRDNGISTEQIRASLQAAFNHSKENWVATIIDSIILLAR